jgi:hypothetical protein
LITVQRRLAVLWVCGAVGVLLLVVVQSIGGKYGGSTERAWAWLLPTVLPTLALIVGALASSARQPDTADTVDRFAFRLCFGLSLVYLVLVAAVPLVQPLTTWTPLELMEMSNLWLGPIQGVVALSLGAFYMSGKGKA